MSDSECPSCGEFIDDMAERFANKSTVDFKCPHCDIPLTGEVEISYRLAVKCGNCGRHLSDGEQLYTCDKCEGDCCTPCSENVGLGIMCDNCRPPQRR